MEETYGAGDSVKDLYREGAGVALGHQVALRTRGRHPEWWVRISTGMGDADFQTLQQVAEYIRGSFSGQIDNEDLAQLSLDSRSTSHDMFAVGARLLNIFSELDERGEVHPRLDEWRSSVERVVDNFYKGVHIARVNNRIKYDSGDMLAVFLHASRGSTAYVGTKHGITRRDLQTVCDQERILGDLLNQIPLVEGRWIKVLRGQPYKSTDGVVAELVMRDGQKSTRVFGTDLNLALAKGAMIGREKVEQEQIVGPSGNIVDDRDDWNMRAGRLYVRGVRFVREDAAAVAVPKVVSDDALMHKYHHLRVLSGAVTVGRGNVDGVDATEIRAGSSILILPGVQLMVGPKRGVTPSSFALSTLHLPRKYR